MPTTTLDAATDFAQHVIGRLIDEPLAWLTTIGHRSGAPVPSVIWFLWNGSELLILSQPDKPKLHNIEANPAVAINLQAGRNGDDVAVIASTAVHDSNGMTEDEWDAFAMKYSAGIVRLGFASPEAFLDSFSELIRITPGRVRGFH